MMRYYCSGYGMMSYGWSFLMMIGILFIVIFSILALVKFTHNTVPVYVDNSVSKSIEILNERYARGEISYEEYRRIIADLKS